MSVYQTLRAELDKVKAERDAHVQQIATLRAENERLTGEWDARYNTPPWRSLERMYRESYPGRDVVHSDVLRWADTFIAARRDDRAQLAAAEARATTAEREREELREQLTDALNEAAALRTDP